MEWSRPTQQGEVPSPRAGHAGATVGESWFIAGGGDNKSGMLLCISQYLDFYTVKLVGRGKFQGLLFVAM